MTGNGSIESRIADPDAIVLDIRGALNAACEKDLWREFEKGIEKSKNIILNLSELPHMDTEGVGLLVMYAVRAARKNLSVAAYGLTDSLRDVFHLTRLDEAIALVEDEKAALCRPNFRGKSVLSRDIPSPYDGTLFPGWARSIDSLSIRDIPAEAMNINVEGREPTSPVQGFGQLWDKKYRLHVNDDKIEPQQIVSVWRSEFPAFWPKGNRLYPSGRLSIGPGTTAVLNLAVPGGLVLATGLMVIYADETSFGFTTIQGHILSGWITFSSFRENSATIIQVHPLFRASDPLMELGFRLGAGKQEDQFWHETLGNLARRLGVSGEIEQQDALIDAHIQWREWKNLRYNAAIRSALSMPFYLLRKMFKS